MARERLNPEGKKQFLPLNPENLSIKDRRAGSHECKYRKDGLAIYNQGKMDSPFIIILLPNSFIT